LQKGSGRSSKLKNNYSKYIVLSEEKTEFFKKKSSIRREVRSKISVFDEFKSYDDLVIWV
jgi:hypothetical protein